MEDEQNGNGKVTLALVKRDIDTILSTLKEQSAAAKSYQEWQQAQYDKLWEYVRSDHETIVTLPCAYHEKDLAKLDTSVKALVETDKAITKDIENKNAAVWQQMNVGKWLAGLMTTVMVILTYFSTLGRNP